jgi:hypothetical protein
LRHSGQLPASVDATPTSRYTDALTDILPGKRRADETDVETQLLEANRRRLLAQHDWIGIAPSQPLYLNLPSSNEKCQVGKRRRTQGKHGTTARHQDHANMVTATQQVQPAGDRHTRAFASGASKLHPRDIHIRIGMDALTTACSTFMSSSARSQASSDPMLFDQHDHHTEQPDMQDAIKSNCPKLYPLNEFRVQKNDTANHEKDWIDERAECWQSPCRLVRAHAREDSRGKCGQRTRKVFPNSGKHFPAIDVPINQDTTSELRLMHQVHGVGHCPLRFVFTHPNSPEGDPGRDAGRDIGSGGTIHALDVADAGASHVGPMHHLDMEPEVQFNNEADATAAIVDEKPWGSFVDVPEESSSHTRKSKHSEKSALQPHPAALSCEAERSTWSQHATQGDQTHISSSVISASLPSLRRQTVHGLDADGNCRNNTTAVSILSEDEQLWRNIVFGNDEQLSSETMHERQEDSELRTGRASSGYLPLSSAVSSIRRTPFSPTSVQMRCRGDGVHDAAVFAPPSGSITSPAATAIGLAEDFSNEDRDADMAAFGEHSVTHASLLNNASGDTNLNFWRTPSRTGMSRGGLERTDSDRDSWVDRETRRGLKPSSAYDILECDDEGLDLVDASRLF